MRHARPYPKPRLLLYLALLPFLFSSALSAAGLSELHRARAATSDEFRTVPQAHALWLPGIGTDFVFTPETTFREHADGTALLSGEVVDRDDGGKRFKITLALRRFAADAPPGSPRRALEPGAYADAGGPVDPATWRYYREARGTLRGRGDYRGAVVEIRERGPAFQVGAGASNANVRFGASGWIHYRVTSQPTAGHHLSEASSPWGAIGDLNFELDLIRCVDPAVTDPVHGIYPGGHALTLPGIGNDFVLERTPGTLVEIAGGTAHLSGVARSAAEPRRAFEVDLRLGGRRDAAPAGSPKKELDPGAYLENGGPVDPGSWHYYTELEGTLTGLDDLAGARLEVTLTGPAFQVGFGANGKNLGLGASGWLVWTAVSQPHRGTLPPGGEGDANLDLGACLTACVRAAAADLDYLEGTHGGRAFHLSELGDYEFSRPGTFIEYEDRAVLRGTVRRRHHAGRVFDVEMRFTDRVDAPPPGSPAVEVLPDMAFAADGGPIRTGRWHYYRHFEGTLIGRDRYEGAVVRLTPRGPAFQVGDGASNRSTLFGGSGWLTYAVERQGDLETLPEAGDGDGRFDFECPRKAPPKGGCYAADVVRYQPGPSGAGTLVAARADPSRALGRPQSADALEFVSLGFGGTLTLRFAERVVNAPGGRDLGVIAAVFDDKRCRQYPDRARILASGDGETWTELGNACHSGWFDLGSLPGVRYVRIEDVSNPGDFFAGTAADGFSVDGLVGRSCEPD